MAEVAGQCIDLLDLSETRDTGFYTTTFGHRRPIRKKRCSGDIRGDRKHIHALKSTCPSDALDGILHAADLCAVGQEKLARIQRTAETAAELRFLRSYLLFHHAFLLSFFYNKNGCFPEEATIQYAITLYRSHFSGQHQTITLPLSSQEKVPENPSLRGSHRSTCGPCYEPC